MNKPVKVLIVEDSEDDAKLALRALRQGGFDPTHRRVQTAAELESALAGEAWDAVLSDFNMPGFTGMDALRIFRSTGLDIPFILISGTIGEETAVNAMKAGASDYVMKKSLARLAPALERELKETQVRAANRQAQQAILREKSFINSALESLPGLFYLIDDQGRFLRWNRNFEMVSGYSSEEISHSAPTDFFAGAGKELIAARIEQVFVTGEATAEADFVAKDRTKTPYFFTGSRVQIDQKPCLIGMGIDIAERKRAERELQRFRVAMDVSPDSIYLTDLETMRFVYVNDTTCRRLGYTHERLLQMGPLDVLAADREKIRREYDEVIAAGDSGLIHERRFLRSDGTEGWTELHRRALRTEEGTLIVTIGRDVTERKQADEKIRRLNRVYAVTSGINSLIVRAREREELFMEICRIAVEDGGFSKAWIGIVDGGSKQFRIVAAHGGDLQFFPILEKELNKHHPAGRGLAARAFATQRPVISNDMASDPQVLLKDYTVPGGARSLAILPLIVSGDAVGVFALNADVPGFFDDNEMRLLTELAGNVAFAIDHIDKQARLDYLGYYDELTGLANRTLFLDRVAQHMRSAASGGHKLAVFLIDLERFKNINDSLGQPAGDALLQQVAEWLTRNAGDANLLARLGADHFAAVLPVVKQDGDLGRLLEKTMAAIVEHPFRLNDAVFRVAARFGAALFPDDGADADTVFRHAEAALKKAKASGERCLFYTQTMTDAVAGKLTLENQLRQALDNEEFVLHYQPKVNLASGKLTGAEALIRWNDPRTGLVPPGRFIPILEETGLIYNVGRWALRKAIEDYLRWRAAGLAAVRIAVNVSPLQLRHRGFVDEIRQVIGIDAQAPAGLELEITESVIMEDVKGTIASLQAIRDLGVSITIDGFGTGFSSLSYLAKLPVDTLKIDRSFVIDMTVGPEGLALVSTIINLAHSLNLKVVADGVETEEQSRLLHLLACDEMQGFLFSEPVPAEIFETRFLAPRPRSTMHGDAPG